VAIKLDKVEYAGSLHDPVAAVGFCAPQHVDWNVIGGKIIVKDGHLLTIDVPKLVEKHNRAANRLVYGR